GAGRDGADELGVVSFVLIGVPAREPADLGGELAALADVAVDGHRVAGAGVGPGECLAARGGELDEAGRGEPSGWGEVHVSGLPDVIVPAVQRAPADEDVGGTLGHSLAVDHPFAVMAVTAGLGVSLVHRGPGLLDLQEQRIDAGPALQ